jgi:sugar transferase (PEP-CTERM/EpsH1 system associated)
MRILCLTSRLPYPPDRGDRLRAYNFIKRLSQDHELSLVSFIVKESERDHLGALRAYCQDVQVLMLDRRQSALSVALNLWRRAPLQALYYRSGAMRRLIGHVLADGDFDAAYVHLFRMAPYLADWSNGYRVVDLTDVISQEVIRSLPYRDLVWRGIYGLDRPRIERYERDVAYSFEETWLISDADRRVLAASCPEANIQVVTNGVDVGRFHPTGGQSEPNSLIFVGHLRVFHNVDAVTHLVGDVLPLVRQQVPECTLKIVGANPDSQVQRLASDPAVTVTGFVEDLNGYLNRATVFAAPLRFAAGVQNKVLEAMAAARPVVTSSIVNDGLGGQPGQDILTADDAEATARQIVALLRDEELRARIGRAGLEFVRRKYSWEHVAARMGAIEQLLLAGHRERAV